MRIDFRLRSDAAVKPGGDTSKAQRLAAMLNEAGHDARVVSGAYQRRAVDVVHLVNLDLPLENTRLAKVARAQGAAVVLSSVHHPFAGIASYFAHGDDRYFARLRRLGVSYQRAILLREAAKLATRTHRPIAGRPGTARAAQLALVDSVDLVLPMTPGERDAIRTDLGYDGPMSVVPNGMTFAAQQGSDTTARWQVCVVGRVEPRKHTLAIARALHEARLTAVFVGAPNANHTRYHEEFRSVVDSSDRLEYLGPIDNSAVADVLRRSEVYLNPAWFEVVSQADVEAACLGLRIATTPYSYTRDVIGPAVDLHPEMVTDNGAETVLRAYQSAGRCPIGRVQSWQDAARELELAYQKVLSG